MPIVVGVKFKQTNKVYYFSPLDEQFAVGDGVIVETAKGVEFGTIAHANMDVEESRIVQPLKPVTRKATEKDWEIVKKYEERKPEAIKVATEKIQKHKLEMKLVDVEYTFDGSKIVFYFTSDGRVDFRELVRDLAANFRMRIELRQIGIRDECKMLGGVAPCGRACCCSQHLSEFEHVSIKMAKNQGLSLNPAKISGLCGRLMCCLQYENAHYVQTAKKMPKQGSEVKTPDGKGTVLSNNLLKELVRVRVPNKSNPDEYEIKDYTLGEVSGKETVADELEKDNGSDQLLDLLD